MCELGGSKLAAGLTVSGVGLFGVAAEDEGGQEEEDEADEVGDGPDGHDDLVGLADW